ncbi:MAG: prolipoprotein diacylglyceryl transferase [Acidobacteria bacterium]|nr:prolipoprotein diacylglyceryl transferase [Acidobacteriota bacterium]
MFPQIFHIGQFALPTYGLMAAIGLVVGLSVVVRGARLQGIDPEKAWNLGLVAILSALLGAKLLMIATEWDTYHDWHAIFSMQFLQAAGVFYGGLIGAILACSWYIRRNRLPLLRTCDVFAPGIALGHAFGRLGCFAAGCCYGKPTRLPWGITFSNPLSLAPLNVALQPTQLYEFLVELGNFAILWWLLKHKKFEGQIIGTYLFIYGVARFFLEFLRDDPGRGSVFGGALSATQLISIFLVIAGGLLWLRRAELQQPTRAAA